MFSILTAMAVVGLYIIAKTENAKLKIVNFIVCKIHPNKIKSKLRK